MALLRGSRSKSPLFILLFLLGFLYFQAPYLDSLLLSSSGIKKSEIPNVIHFIWTLPDPESDFSFEFKHFLSIYAARYHWQPDTIYLHTNAKRSSIERAEAGAAGKWSKLIMTLPGVHVRRVEAPTHAGNGKEITYEEHKTDFLRAALLHDLGGIFVDWDVYGLRNIGALRKTGFEAVVGRMEGRQLQVNSGTLFSKKGSRMSKLYMERMHKVYDGQYTTHANILITGVCEHLAPEPGEVLILDQNAFTPGSWLASHLSMFYEQRSDWKSNLEGIEDGDALPNYPVDRKADFFDKPENLVDSWERHFFDSYMIHAFQPGIRNIPNVAGFDHISPRYILERRSNFARALYPVVKDMYEKRLIKINDPFKG